MNSSSTRTRPTRLRRVAVITGLVAILGGAWWWNVPALVTHAFIERAFDRRDLVLAESWLGWSGAFSNSHPHTQFLLARLCRKSQNWDEMYQHLKLASRAGEDQERVRREEVLARIQVGDFKSVQNDVRDLLVDQRGDGREISEALTNGFIINSQFPDAVAVIDAWKLSYPKDGQPDYFLGRIAEHGDWVSRAEQHYRDALGRDPDHRPSLYRLGSLLIARHRSEESVTLFRRLQSLGGGAATAIGEARAHRTLGKSDEARRLLSAVRRLPSEELQRSFRRLGESADEVSVEYELGTIETDAGNFAEAFELLTAALQQDSHNLEARYSLAIALRGLNRLAEAKLEFQRVDESKKQLKRVDQLVDTIRATPDSSHLAEKLELGEVYMTYGSRKTGEYWLKQVLVIDPACRRAHELLAEYYDERGRTQSDYRQQAEYHRRAARR